jgi:hypothetical protein
MIAISRSTRTHLPPLPPCCRHLARSSEAWREREGVELPDLFAAGLEFGTRDIHTALGLARLVPVTSAALAAVEPGRQLAEVRVAVAAVGALKPVLEAGLGLAAVVFAF